MPRVAGAARCAVRLRPERSAAAPNTSSAAATSRLADQLDTSASIGRARARCRHRCSRPGRRNSPCRTSSSGGAIPTALVRVASSTSSRSTRCAKPRADADRICTTPWTNFQGPSLRRASRPMPGGSSRRWANGISRRFSPPPAEWAFWWPRFQRLGAMVHRRFENACVAPPATRLLGGEIDGSLVVGPFTI